MTSELDVKCCTKCGTVKPLSEFYVSKVLKSGRRSRCVLCELDGAAEKSAIWHSKNKDRANANSKAWYERNKEKAAEYARDWTKAHRDSRKDSNRRYRAANKEKIAAAARARKEANPELRKAAVSKYEAKNRDKRQASSKGRRAAVCAASQPFDKELDDLVLSEAQVLSSLRKKITGGEWHIDHIEPLRGKNVCGLHNAYNIQVVPAQYNRSKGNKQVDHHWIQDI